MIINAGIKVVKYQARYSIDDAAREMLTEAGVEMEQVWVTKGELCDFVSLILKGIQE
jgi:deoxycytidylate deaminase